MQVRIPNKLIVKKFLPVALLILGLSVFGFAAYNQSVGNFKIAGDTSEIPVLGETTEENKEAEADTESENGPAPKISASKPAETQTQNSNNNINDGSNLNINNNTNNINNIIGGPEVSVVSPTPSPTSAVTPTPRPRYEMTFANWYLVSPHQTNYTNTYDAQGFISFDFSYSCSSEIFLQYSNDQSVWNTQLSISRSQCYPGGMQTLDVQGRYYRVEIGPTELSQNFVVAQAWFYKL